MLNTDLPSREPNSLELLASEYGFCFVIEEHSDGYYITEVLSEGDLIETPFLIGLTESEAKSFLCSALEGEV